ncbi:MAG: molybdopterin cofactor-binding domain-containing protein, partial [Pseudomonadota bacterium]
MSKILQAHLAAAEARSQEQTGGLSRRGFLITGGAVGAGLSIGLLSACAPQADGPEEVAIPEVEVPEVNAWVHIATDNTITVRVVRSEMGQGTLTGLAQMVAEELNADWDLVTTEYPTPGESVRRERVWGSFSTGGSQGIRGSHQYVREGGASARIMLTEAAAARWEVPVSEVTAEKSILTHGPSGRTLTYGEVAAEAA